VTTRTKSPRAQRFCSTTGQSPGTVEIVATRNPGFAFARNQPIPPPPARRRRSGWGGGPGSDAPPPRAAPAPPSPPVRPGLRSAGARWWQRRECHRPSPARLAVGSRSRRSPRPWPRT
jgi:hypothetical protein